MKASAKCYKDLLLIGGGHSHVIALRMMAMKPIEGLRITLVSPSVYTPYSGMLPGLIVGHYDLEETHIDLPRLCGWAGARFIQAEVTGLDVSSCAAHFADRPALQYDVVSLDIGAQPALAAIPGAQAHAIAVKPVANFWQRWQRIDQQLKALQAPQSVRVSIVGAGAGGVELALAMAHRWRSQPVRIDLWCAADQPLPQHAHRAQVMAAKALEVAGVSVHRSCAIESIDAHTLRLTSGERVPYDEVFVCTSSIGAPWIARTGLPVDDRGFLQVSDTLQSLGDKSVFAAGDIATQYAHPRPKAGVFAVRQGPVLAHNLRAFLLGRPLRKHVPQRQFLSLIGLGDRRAIATRNGVALSGSWAWRWKHRIDQRFMAHFSDLPVMRARGFWGSVATPGEQDQQDPCGGCGAKVGAQALTQALTELSNTYPAAISLSSDDVAAVYPQALVSAPPPVDRLVQSIDVLRELVSDPFVMGRIAANHALSDLFASGVLPRTALAIVTLPFAVDAIMQRDLQQLLAGALVEFERVSCQLVGGHSMQGAELSLGFSVVGELASGDCLLEKCSGIPDDVLILTKPLGIGVVYAAHMQGKASGDVVESAQALMLQSNERAGELAREFAASACTDVTGFGLAGHLVEMLGDHLDAQVDLSSLPLIQGSLTLLEKGLRSSLHAVNKQSVAARVSSVTPVDPLRTEALFDPQTSGGLLIACPRHNADDLLIALQASGYSGACRIGVLSAASEGHSGRLLLQ